MSTEVSPAGHAFAAFIRDARLARGWTQERLVEETGISRSTIIRWEKGAARLVEVENVRAACTSLGADPREAVIALGFVTRDELGLPPAPPPLDPLLQSAAKLLGNDDISVGAKNNLRTLIEAAVGFTYESLGLRKPAQMREATTPERSKPTRR